MTPTIQEGEKIAVMPLKPAEIRRGDIVLYRKREGLIAHRVMAVESAGRKGFAFILRGDALQSCDEPVEERQVFGKVIWVERGGRSIRLDNRRARLSRAARVHASNSRKWMKAMFGAIRCRFGTQHVRIREITVGHPARSPHCHEQA